jgi:hypothetical protein
MRRLIFALLFLFFSIIGSAQPQIFLNSSKMAVERYMVNEGDWYLVAADKGLLSYCNKYTKVVVSYSFERLRGRFGYFCTGVVLDFPDSVSCDAYIDDKVSELRFRQGLDSLSWVLVTDLVDYLINVFRVGNSVVFMD